MRRSLLIVTLVGQGIAPHPVSAAGRSSGTVVTADYLEPPPATAAVPTGAPREPATRTPIRRDAEDQPGLAGARRPSSPASTLVTLGLILGVAYVTLLLFKRRGAGQDAEAPDAIDVLSSRRLDGQATLHLVRIGRKVLAVGSTANDIRTLAVIEDPAEIALLVNDGRDARTPSAATAHNRPGDRRLPATTRRDRHSVSSPAADVPARRTQ